MAGRNDFSAPEAADLAGVSYRQIDYWARRGWVTPSRVFQGAVHRRMYSEADIVRVAALGHLGRSRVDVGVYAKATGRLQVPQRRGFVIVWELNDGSVSVLRTKDLRRLGQAPGQYVLFDPTPLRRRMRRYGSEVFKARRRRFSVEYKLGVLGEYERLTEPGAKTALLRREGLHTSHLVAWQRARHSGNLRSP